jgi:hypothetical protein
MPGQRGINLGFEDGGAGLIGIGHLVIMLAASDLCNSAQC